MEESPQEDVMEAMENIVPIISNHRAHSCEEVITAIAKILRLKGITVDVLRDTSIGAYVRDLLDNPCVQVQSAALIALDCFETMLFDWAESVGWSTPIITDHCMDADRQARHRAVIASMNSCNDGGSGPIESIGSSNFHIGRPGSSSHYHAKGVAAKNSQAELPSASPEADEFYTPSSEEVEDSPYSPMQESKRGRPYATVSRRTPPVTRSHAHA